MSAAVAWERPALEALLALARADPGTARRVLNAIYHFAEEAQGDVRKLEGASDLWRLRTGDWRVIFTRREGTVSIVEIVNRRDAYR